MSSINLQIDQTLMETQRPLLSVKDLSISFGKKKALKEVVHSISFAVYENEILGIVGESGSGKSVTSMAIMGLLPKRNAHIKGQINFKDSDILTARPDQLRALRGSEIAMIFQEPMSALNPSMHCGTQVAEILQLHKGLSRSEAREEVLSLFNKVKLPRAKEIYRSYPHQISGGQMQRVMIAMAIACKPKLLIADEPTTALDVTVQKEILALLKSIQKETRMAMLFISHDLNLVSEIADKVLVMYRGKQVEMSDTKALFSNPKEEYTKALLASRPTLDSRPEVLPTIASLSGKTYKSREVTPAERARRHKKLYFQDPILEVVDVEKHYISNPSFFSKKKVVRAVDGVSFSVYPGETLGLVGESGCGKSTLGKTILQLEAPTSGSIRFYGQELTTLSPKAIQKLRKEIQIIFQDPYASLNPRLPIGHAIREPMEVHGLISSKKEGKEKVMELLEKVGLDASFYDRYPHELSGGQRQRVGIARTVAVAPKLIICDESVSALDISVQAQVLNLLNELKKDFGFTYIFISHDLAVVKYMSDQLMVMNRGKIEEIGDADEVYAQPRTAYTKRLIEAIPQSI